MEDRLFIVASIISLVMTTAAHGEDGASTVIPTQNDPQLTAPTPLPNVRFPRLEGHDIDHRRYVVPDELEGRFNLLLVAYERSHQRLVDTWIDRARELESSNADVRVYEVPLIRRLSWFGRKQLDFWMSQGISDPLARATTITIYTDVGRVNDSLNIPDPGDIRLFLIDRSGAVFWQGSGPYDAHQYRSLEQIVRDLHSGRPPSEAAERRARA